jgi:hypothetical protein
MGRWLSVSGKGVAGLTVAFAMACGSGEAPEVAAPEVPAEAPAAPAAPAAPEAASPAAAPSGDLPSAGVPVASWSGPTLCQPGENVVESCVAGARTVSLCASGTISATEGYLQYRIGKPGALELEFPATRQHPRGLFTYNMGIQGNSGVAFKNDGFEYTLFDDLRSDEDGVIVEKDGKVVANIKCAFGGAGFSINRPDLLGMSDTPFGN